MKCTFCVCHPFIFNFCFYIVILFCISCCHFLAASLQSYNRQLSIVCTGHGSSWNEIKCSFSIHLHFQQFTIQVSRHKSICLILHSETINIFAVGAVYSLGSIIVFVPTCHLSSFILRSQGSSWMWSLNLCPSKRKTSCRDVNCPTLSNSVRLWCAFIMLHIILCCVSWIKSIGKIISQIILFCGLGAYHKVPPCYTHTLYIHYLNCSFSKFQI